MRVTIVDLGFRELLSGSRLVTMNKVHTVLVGASNQRPFPECLSARRQTLQDSYSLHGEGCDIDGFIFIVMFSCCKYFFLL